MCQFPCIIDVFSMCKIKRYLIHLKFTRKKVYDYTTITPSSGNIVHSMCTKGKFLHIFLSRIRNYIDTSVIFTLTYCTCLCYLNRNLTIER